MKTRFWLVLCLGAFSTTELLHAQEDGSPKNAVVSLSPETENLNVFQDWIKWSHPGSLLIDHLTEQAVHHYDIRDQEIEKLKTEREWIERQAKVKRELIELVGSFPARTALNPRITGTIRRDGYRIEKIVYESMPGLFVTGCLYVPDNITEKAPAILNVIGHNQEAFRAPLYQVINYNLVKKGMIVFAIDPPGQGEHVQYFDPNIDFSSVGYTVIEHCYFGNQCFLSGSCAARYFIWDGIRAIDYLLTREEVDPERIGVTGFSGGGTITSYISAFDDRVKVSVPCSWSTLNRRLLETKGCQDAETLFPNGVAKGITFEDLLEVRAPKPTLMTFVSRDEYLCLQGARDAYSEAKRAYRVLGDEDNIKLVEDDSKHWMTAKIRLAIYAFFMQHFGLSGDTAEAEADILPEKELWVTPTGQVSTSLGGRMIFDVNREETASLIENLEASRRSVGKHLGEVKVDAKRLSGFIAPSAAEQEPFLNGRYQRDGYSVAKYAIVGEGKYAIPILLFAPSDHVEKHPAVVYLHPGGKITEARPGGEIEALVQRGYVVAAADVLGVGETKSTSPWNVADGYTAVAIGRSVVGIQAGDIVRVAEFLRSRPDVDSAEVGAVGIGAMCIPLVHAAAFDSSISSVVLIGAPISYKSIAMNRTYKIGMTNTGYEGTGHPHEFDFSWGVSKALTAYDLPDLIGCIAPRKVAVADLQNQILESASADLVKQEMSFPRSAFTLAGEADNLKIVAATDSPDDLVDWCFRQ